MNCVFLDKKTFVEKVDTTAIEQQVSSFMAYDFTNEQQIVERCLHADIVITNKVVLTEQLLTQLPRLKLICVAATGVNNVDIKAAKKLGIAVTNVSGYSAPSVSQYVFAQLLTYFSDPIHHQKNVEQGLWQSSPSFCFHGNGSQELAGKSLAIIGYGSLGKAVATIGQAFGMNIIIAERPNANHIRTGRVSFEQALRQADVVSLHCPLTTETQHLINENALNLMKPSAILINTARGGIVDEQALLNALVEEKIAFAILDVLAQEPPPADYFLITQQPTNLKITAHIAWASTESQQRLLNLIAGNIADFTRGKLTNRVDE